ncbi:MAG: TraB/GumN family protein [Betaproteobacteria bacterium]|nr:MAG: TraB/GumN family protein [Betaproteobacteria bacterium]
MIRAARCTALRHAAGWMVLIALSASNALAEPFHRGLLWQLDRPGALPSWVFGTLHSNDPRVTTLPAPVARAFARARTFAMEIYLSEFEEAGFFEAMQFDDNRRLAPLVGDETYAKLREALGSEVPEEALARTKPWAAFLRIAQLRGAGRAPTLDRVLFADARARHMTMIGLESLDEQIAVLDTIPLDTQVALLRHLLAHRAELEAEVEPTTRAWLARDLAALARINRAAGAGDPELARHYAALARALVEDRSALMAYRLFLPLRHGGVFVAVGALHLYGTKGLLAQLREQGFRLRRVY